MADIEVKVKKELELYEKKQLALDRLTKELESNPQFRAFIKAQKQFKKLEQEVWDKIEQAMLDNDIRQVKTDKVILSIATRTSFDIDLDQLPNRYIKRVPDTTKINGAYKLEGRPPKGCTPRELKFLVKRFKEDK